MTTGQMVSYVYGIVPADTQKVPAVHGVGDPPGEVSLVRHRDVAALVSPIDGDRPLGKPEDLRAHFALLNSAATQTPVLPLRFGAVMTEPAAVAAELLAPHHDEFAEDLAQFEGHLQYFVKGRYEQDTLLKEVLAENPQAQQLRDEIRDIPAEAAREKRMMLGEIVHSAIQDKRDTDTQRLLDALRSCAEAVEVREPSEEEDAFHVAVLVRTDEVSKMERAVEGLTQEWNQRLHPWLVGPMAPYDFIVTRDARD